MSLFRRISQTAFGKWALRQTQRPLLGPAIYALSRGVKRTEQRMISLLPKNWAHDRRQRATLAAFERRSQAAATRATKAEAAE